MKRLLLIAILSVTALLVWPTCAFAASAFLNNNTALYTASGSLSGSQTVNAGGTNVVAFARVGWDIIAGLSVTAITYNGVTMTPCGAAESLSDTENSFATVKYVQWFYVVNPSSGSHTLAITVGGGTVTEIYATLVVYQGVDQTTPVRPGSYTVLAHAAGTTTAAITIPSDAADWTVSAITEGRNGIGTTGQTAGTSDTNGSLAMADDRCTTPAASVTHTWSSVDAGDGAVLAGFSIQAAGGGGGGTASPQNLTILGAGPGQ